MGQADMERWLAETKRAVDEVRAHFAELEMEEVDGLIAHGEPVIALSSLAHLIVRKEVLVPPAVIDHIRDSVTGTSEERFLPATLGDFVSPHLGESNPSEG